MSHAQLELIVSRHEAKHARDIARLVPLMTELAVRAGPDGVCVGDLRLVAERRGLIEPAPKDRRLSWLCKVPQAAGLIPTNRRRLCVQRRSRNSHVVYVHKIYVGER